MDEKTATARKEARTSGITLRRSRTDRAGAGEDVSAGLTSQQSQVGGFRAADRPRGVGPGVFREFAECAGGAVAQTNCGAHVPRARVEEANHLGDWRARD